VALGWAGLGEESNRRSGVFGDVVDAAEMSWCRRLTAGRRMVADVLTCAEKGLTCGRFTRALVSGELPGGAG
jgi:hypothetical protein